MKAFEYYEASAIVYLGFVKNIRQRNRDEGYYEEMRKKRLRLLNKFEKDPILVHPLRFDEYKNLIF